MKIKIERMNRRQWLSWFAGSAAFAAAGCDCARLKVQLQAHQVFETENLNRLTPRALKNLEKEIEELKLSVGFCEFFATHFAAVPSLGPPPSGLLQEEGRTQVAGNVLGPGTILAATSGPSPNAPDENRTYILDAGDETILVVDDTSGAVIDRLQLRPTGDFGARTILRELALTRGGETLIVGSVEGPAHLAFVDTATRQLVERVAMPAGSFPSKLTPSRDGSLLYVATVHGTTAFDGQRRSIQILDLASRSFVGEIDLGPSGRSVDQLSALVESADGGLLFLLDVSSTANPLVFVDLTSRTLSTELRVFGGPRRLAVHPDGTRLYVYPFRDLAGNGLGVGVIDVAAAVQTGFIALPREPRGVTDLVISPLGELLLVSDHLASSVWHVDTLLNQVTGQTDTGEGVVKLFIA